MSGPSSDTQSRQRQDIAIQEDDMQPTISMLLEAEDSYRREHVTDDFRRGSAREHHSHRTARGQGRRWHWHRTSAS